MNGKHNLEAAGSLDVRPLARSAPQIRQSMIISDLAGMDEFAGTWERVEPFLHSPMEQFIWSRAAAETVAAGYELKVVFEKLGADSMAIAPLKKKKGLGSPYWMISTKSLYEPMDFIYTDKAAVDALAERLIESGSALILRRMAEDSPVVEAIQKACRGRGLIYISPSEPSPYMILDEGWKEPESQFNSGRRSDFRRMQRHAGQMGEVTFEILTPTPSELEPLLEEAYQVEMASWKGVRKSALLADKLIGDFFRRYAVLASEKGILRLCFMRINGEAVGMQIAVETCDRFWLFKIGHNEKYARCSPGNLLMMHTVKYAADRGLQSYEFLGTAESWTRLWCKYMRRQVHIRIYPYTFSGLTSLAFDSARIAISRLKKKIRGKS